MTVAMLNDNNSNENIVGSEQITTCEKLTTHTTDGTQTKVRHMNRITKHADVHTHGYAHEENTQAKGNEIDNAYWVHT
jgi:ssRNA-specific RNase YbeY (16S rRNA maturation enzyme)